MELQNDEQYWVIRKARNLYRDAYMGPGKPDNRRACIAKVKELDKLLEPYERAHPHVKNQPEPRYVETPEERPNGAAYTGPRLFKIEIMAMSENAIKAMLHNMGYDGVDDLSDEEATDKLLAWYGYEFDDNQL